MLAQVQRSFGGEAALAFEEVADPVPAAGEVVVAVRACALNRLDLLQRDAPLVRGFALPHVAGMDVAGVVVARHVDLADGSGPAIGDSVVIDPVNTCGECERCTHGLAPYCENLRTVGSTRPGGFAELVAAPASRVFPMPSGLTFVEAATIPVAAMTAFHAIAAGAFVPGESVLVNGAGSGVSLALLQLLQAKGATVITTAGGAEKVRRARTAGYDYAIDYRAENIAEVVRSLTNGHGVSLVIDHVGPALFAASIESLALGGRMVFCGTTTGTEVVLSLPSVYHWGRTLIGAGGYQPGDFPVMLDAISATGRSPVIDSVWSFDQLPQAQRRMESGEFFGKIVVELP
ncbi:MAG TPA: zinc-binding dehydrogenase [Ilumatobacteraceae bacterium]